MLKFQRIGNQSNPNLQHSTMHQYSQLFYFDILDSTHVPRHLVLKLVYDFLSMDWFDPECQEIQVA